MIKSKTRPRCGCCGKPIEKLTTTHWLHVKNDGTRLMSSKDHLVDKMPTTREECAQLVNEEIVTVRRWTDGTISRFATWDGESWNTRYKFFCSNNCAADFGQLAYEKTTLRTKQWTEATAEVSP
jgi:hypothetical protein